MRVAAISYATDQGLAHLMRDFYRSGVVTDPIIYRHSSPGRPTHADWYPPGTPVVEPRQRLAAHPQVAALLDEVDVLLAFETFFDWSVIGHCRAKGVRTALVVMYEWFPHSPPDVPDLFLCPSLLDKDYFPGGVFLPVPADPSLWKPRTRARRFLHNAGHIGYREHKGTRQVLEAVQHIQSPVELTVRSQEPALLDMARQVLGPQPDPRVRIEVGDFPRGGLFDGHDVYVAPEKLNGLSLPLQEACASGLMVMASDRYPANAWLPREPLIPVRGYQRAKVAGPYLEFDEALVDPRDVAATIDAWFDKDIAEISERGRAWALANSWGELTPKYREVLAG